MNFGTEPSPPPVPEGQGLGDLVSGDRPCLQCGYSLTGLLVTGNCPECGTPVANSLRGNLLFYSAADYLDSLHRGSVLVIAGVVVGIAATIGAFVFGIAVTLLTGGRQGAGPAPGFAYYDLVDMTGRASGLVASFLGLLGWWLLSAPDPGLVGADRSINARKLLRAVVGIGLVSALAAFLLSMINYISPLSGTRFLFNPYTTISHALWFIGGIASIVQFFASMRYLQWLARRIPDRSLYEQAGRFEWLGPLIYVLGWICFWLGPLVSLILYAAIINQLRGHLKAIGSEASRSRVTTPPAGPPADAHPSPPGP